MQGILQALADEIIGNTDFKPHKGQQVPLFEDPDDYATEVCFLGRGVAVLAYSKTSIGKAVKRLADLRIVVTSHHFNGSKKFIWLDPDMRHWVNCVLVRLGIKSLPGEAREPEPVLTPTPESRPKAKRRAQRKPFWRAPDEVIDGIRTMWKEGWSIGYIAKKMGVHRCTVRKYVPGAEA